MVLPLVVQVHKPVGWHAVEPGHQIVLPFHVFGVGPFKDGFGCFGAEQHPREGIVIEAARDGPLRVADAERRWFRSHSRWNVPGRHGRGLCAETPQLQSPVASHQLGGTEALIALQDDQGSHHQHRRRQGECRGVCASGRHASPIARGPPDSVQNAPYTGQARQGRASEEEGQHHEIECVAVLEFDPREGERSRPRQ